MIRKLESLVPAFLKDFDRHLLLNYPTLWATKAHYLLFVAAGAFGLMGLRAIMPGINLASPPDPEIWFFVAIVPAIVVFLIWAFSASVFSVERFFGITSSLKQLSVQLIYLACIFIVGAGPFIFGHVLSNQLSESVGDAEFAADVNALNMGDVYFSVNEYDYRSQPDQLFGRYWYLDEHQLGIYAEEQLIARFQNSSRAERIKQIAAYQDVVEKYSGYRPEGDPASILVKYKQQESPYLYQYEFDDALTSVHESVELIARAKAGKFDFQDKDAIWGGAFVLFLIWLAFAIYTRVQGRQFLVSVVSGILLFIACGILVALYSAVGPNSTEDFAGGLYLFVFAMLAGQAFINHTPTRRMKFWKTVGLSLATAMMPFVPMVLGLLFVRSHFEPSQTFFAGAILSMVFWNFAFNPRFVELWAAPRQD